MRVIATTQGYDNTAVREPGEEFDMPDNIYDAVPVVDKDGNPTDKKVVPKHDWFKRVDSKAVAQGLV